MTPRAILAPRRFRRRLTLVSVLIAAVSSGFLAATTDVVVGQYRDRTFAAQATHQAELALKSLPPGASPGEVASLLATDEEAASFHALVVVDNSPAQPGPLTLVNVPELLRRNVRADTPPARISIAGVPYLVVARPAPSAGVVYFFFRRSAILESVHEFGLVLLAMWLATIVLAATFGSSVARAILRPVRHAVDSSRATADRLVGSLAVEGDDEFDEWIESYNRLVSALEHRADDLAQRADRERQFTADVAHDLRTPLTGMSSAAAILQDHVAAMPPAARRPAELLIADTKRLRALVTDLLDLARLDAGTEPVRLENLDVERALGAALGPWFNDADVRCDLAPALFAAADRAQFRDVVTNLVENALEHGEPPVYVKGSRSGEQIRIEVSDCGAGVAPNVGDRIFDRFFKADSARTSSGSGLGLAISRERARSCGGDVRLEEGGVHSGARFVFTLPACDPPVTQPKAGLAHRRRSTLGHRRAATEA